MAYNKAKAEKEWLENKCKEEAELRKFHFSENKIAELRANDWELFKSERKYLERTSNIESFEFIVAEEQHIEIQGIQTLLDNIDNLKLYEILSSIDNTTMQIVFYKINGYSLHEISEIVNLTDKAIYRRLDRLKEKIKKVL